MHAQTISKVENGIWKVVYSQPEKMLPDQFKAASKTAFLAAMSIENAPAVSLSQIQFKKIAAGIMAEINAADDERFYGDFNNNKKYQGDSTYQISMGLNEIPMFIKDNTILPLTKPLQFTADSSVFDITCKIYGQPSAQFNLFEDNTFNNDFEKSNYNLLSLLRQNNTGTLVRAGNYKTKLYNITKW